MKIPKAIYRIIIGFFLFLFGKSELSAQQVSVQELHELINTDSALVLIDVRTPAEFEGEMEMLESAFNIELSVIEDSIGYLSQHKDKDIYLICRSGNRSGRAAEKLKAKGFNAINVTGGMLAYRKEYPWGGKK